MVSRQIEMLILMTDCQAFLVLGSLRICWHIGPGLFDRWIMLSSGFLGLFCYLTGQQFIRCITLSSLRKARTWAILPKGTMNTGFIINLSLLRKIQCRLTRYYQLKIILNSEVCPVFNTLKTKKTELFMLLHIILYLSYYALCNWSIQWALFCCTAH